MSRPTRESLEAALREKFATDPGFADELRADPRGVITQLVGRDIPPGITIELHEESLSRIHVVIPASAATEDLAEDDLELVAGGYSWIAGSKATTPTADGGHLPPNGHW